MLFLETENLPGLGVICGLFNDAEKPVDIATKRDEILIVYITTIRRMEERLDL